MGSRGIRRILGIDDLNRLAEILGEIMAHRNKRL